MKYYVRKTAGGQIFGPFSVEEVRQGLQSGEVTTGDEWAQDRGLALSGLDNSAGWAPLSTWPEPGSASNPAVSANSAKGPVGYGGWLMLFAVLRVYVAPVFFLFLVYNTYHTLHEVWGRSQGIVVISVIDLLARSYVMWLGFSAGLKIQRLSSDAVTAARYYLMTALAWAFFSFGLLYLGGDLPQGLRVAIAAQVFRFFLATIFSFGIWWIYFKVSKRVRNTFPEEFKS